MIGAASELGRFAAASGDPLPPADDRLYGPVAFGGGWLAVGIVAIAVGATIFWWAFRPRRRVPRSATPLPTDLRIEYLRHLDGLERRLRSHEISPRSLHHELSATLRRFACDVGAAGATAMSATALDSAGLHQVAAAIRGYERPQFEALPVSDPVAALGVARTVVSGGAVPERGRPG